MKRGWRAAIAFAFLFAVSCAGPTPTSGTSGANASPGGATPGGATSAPGTAASGTGSGSSSPSFKEILSSAKLTEYKVTYKMTATGQGEALAGEQSWYFKQGKARFDFSSTVAGGEKATVSLYALTDGVFMCFGAGAEAQCLGMSGLDTALQSNPAAQLQESLFQNPDQFSGVLVETRQIAGQQAHCYDVKALAGATATVDDGRFCYSTQGIPLLSRFSAPTGTWSMEATILSTTVPDSDFILPATPTILGRP